MIHVIDELKLNDFKEVHCIRPRDLYSRFGHREPNVNFDSNLEEPVPMNMRKLDSIEYLERYDAIMSESSRHAGTEAESNGNNNFDNSQSD